MLDFPLLDSLHIFFYHLRHPDSFEAFFETLGNGWYDFFEYLIYFFWGDHFRHEEYELSTIENNNKIWTIYKRKLDNWLFLEPKDVYGGHQNSLIMIHDDAGSAE
jgi:hypothetical protein